MRCRVCGYRAKDIEHMGKHYRKKHPRSMARKRKSGKYDKKTDRALVYEILKKEGLL